MRSEDELSAFLADFKENIGKDLKCEFTHALVSDVLNNMLRARVAELVRRRVGHIPDYDFVKFVKLFQSDMLKPQDKKGVIIERGATEIVKEKNQPKN